MLISELRVFYYNHLPFFALKKDQTKANTLFINTQTSPLLYKQKVYIFTNNNVDSKDDFCFYLACVRHPRYQAETRAHQHSSMVD